jgi:hypothetical protein
MSFLRNVLHDLIEKRLWPVAIALVAALVAVPIVLGGSSDAGTATPAAPVADASAPNGLANHRDVARAQVVSLEEQAAGKVQRAGSGRDPFVQRHQPKAVTQKQVTAAVDKVAGALHDALSGGSGGAGAGGAPAGGSGPGAITPVVTPTTPSTGTTKKPSADVVYGVKLKFGEAGAEKTYDNPARLTPLPSSDNPFFVYLGLQDDKKHAVFLIDGEAVPSGDGHCDPSPQECEKLTLEAGDLEFFELQTGTAGVVEYQLELTSISKYKAKTKAVAAHAHARESRAGREHLRELVATDPMALDGWDYSKSLGLLIRTDPVATPDVANVPESVADGAAGQAVDQTATVLTVPAP